ncbi:hypothetical protein [Helicobacter sp. 13S00477-4]|nr:hypothetical protein [Helicobacter sp. 13S00477-4]
MMIREILAATLVIVVFFGLSFLAIKTALDMDKDDDKNKKIVKK